MRSFRLALVGVAEFIWMFTGHELKTTKI